MNAVVVDRPEIAPAFPTVIDNTIIETWFACNGKGFMQYMLHWGSATPNVNLHAGGAVAKGIEVARTAFYVNGETEDAAIALGMLAAYTFYGNFQPPANSNKTFTNVGRAIAEYFFQYPMPEDIVQPYTPPGGRTAIEFNFGIPLPINHPDTGEPLMYGGRSDMIGRYNDSIFIVDEKTTTSLGPSWERQWDMAGQFTGYCWAAREHGYPVAGAIIRGLSFLTKGRHGHAQVVSPRSSYHIDFWYAEMLKKVRRAAAQWVEYRKTGSWAAFEWSHGAACKTYGGCQFNPVCTSPQPQRVLPIYFTQRKWDPLHIEEDA